MFRILLSMRFKAIAVFAALISAFVGTLTPMKVGAEGGDSQPRPQYHFDLTKGVGTAVCDAYLKRLNTTDYTSPPYCDRPEQTTVPGFTPLHRVALTAEEVYDLSPRVNQFMGLGHQGSKEEDEAWEAKRKSLGLAPTRTLEAVKQLLQRGQTRVWRYDPPTDINNDGTPDNIVVWQGTPVSHFLGVCGVVASLGPDAQLYDRQSQVVFVLAPSNDRLDIPKTRTIFGHPSGGYRLPDGTLSTKFRPIGETIGIFEYQDHYYFDTFFDNTWGDFHNKRVGDPKLANTLGVFLRQHSETKQICEYHMTMTGHRVTTTK